MVARIQPYRPIQYRERSYVNRCYWSWCRRWWYWYRCRRCYPSYQWVNRDLVVADMTEPQVKNNLSGLSRYYNINFTSIYNNTEIAQASRNYKGAAWVRNLCFSRENLNQSTRKDWINTSKPHSWEFSGKFIEGLVKRYGPEYNWGLPEYRSQGQTLVDSQRDFSP